MITAEEFVVKIKADTKEAKRQIGGLRDLIKGMSEGFKEGMGKSISSETKATKEITKQVKKTTQAKEQSAKASKETAKSDNAGVMALGKMAAVMAVVVKLAQKLANFMKEGVSNAYQFSKATGSGFNEALDRLTSKTEAIKNAFGSIGMSFIQVIEPVISNILDAVFDMISRLSYLIARLFKLPSYLKANGDILKQWDKNNKTTLKLISGLDELNIFEKQDTDVSNMFEKVALPESEHLSPINIIESLLGKQTVDNIKATLTNLGKIFDTLKTKISNLVNSEHFQNLKDALKTLGEKISSVTSQVTSFLSKVFESPAFSSFLNFVTDIFTLISNVGSVVLQFVSDFFGWINGEVSFKDAILNLLDGIANTIWPSIVSVFDSLSTHIIDVIDGIYVWTYNKLHPNNPIEHADFWYGAHGINPNPTSTTHESSSGTEHGGGGRHINTPTSTTTGPQALPDYSNLTNAQKAKILEDWQKRGFTGIPGLANGAVIHKPTLVLTGEYAGAHTNPEIITPENILQENLDANNQTLISAFSQLTRQILQAIANVDMSVTIGDNVIAQSASRGNDQYYKLTGKSLFA